MKLIRSLALVAPLAATGGVALAQTAPPSAVTLIQGIADGQAAYGTVMFSLAVLAVGILVAVKWIKRARGAA